MSGYAKDAILVRELVEYAGVTVTEVARKAKVDPETLRKPLNGRADTRLSQRTLEKLQVAYPGYPGWTQKLESPSMVCQRIGVTLPASKFPLGNRLPSGET